MLSKKRIVKPIGICLMILVSLLYVGCEENVSKEEVTVFAAASLTDVVTDIDKAFEKDNQNVNVSVNFASTKTLRSQLENGASADIFISANEKHYKALLEQNIIVEGKKILENKMVLVVSKEASQRIKTLEDLQKPHSLILGEEGVPVGDYGRQVISNLNEIYGDKYAQLVISNLVSSETNVRQVLTKVVLGEGDAAIVYKTDITKDIKDKVNVIEIPESCNVIASYWIGLVNNNKISNIVHSCFNYFSSDESYKLFQDYGFSVVK